VYVKPFYGQVLVKYYEGAAILKMGLLRVLPLTSSNLT